MFVCSYAYTHSHSGLRAELTINAALVSGNDGRTMVLGFLVDSIDNTDGKKLMQNIFESVLLAAKQ